MIKVTIENKSWTVADLASDENPADMKAALIACYVSGKQPKIEPVHALPFPEAKPTIDVKVARQVFSDWGAPIVDEDAAKRIQDLHDKLKAGGANLNASEQLYATGTRMAEVGYETQGKRKEEHDALMSIADAAHSLISRVTRENREDIDVSASELGRMIEANGKVTYKGRALTEQAIRGLAARLESPFLGYVLGLRDRVAATCALNVKDPDPKFVALRKDDIKADVATIAEVLRHECKRNGDVPLKLRTRNGNMNDVFAIVSQQYAPADAPQVVGKLVDRMSKDHPNAKGKAVYDAASTSWELQAEVWTPTPTEAQAVGEPFRGYASLRGRDNGTGRAGGSGGIELLRCLNASVYTANMAKVSRVHRGAILDDLSLMIDGAIAACSILASAWGTQRQHVIALTDEEKAAGDTFLVGLWTDMLRNDRELAGVLPGRVATHASALTATYHAERRDRDQLVRADLAQSWTRYIQDQPMAVRKDAEDAIGSWLVRGSA